jgi:thiamine-phosphate pyrophosphorylase
VIDLSLYVILDRSVEDEIPIEEFTSQIIEGGATCIQIRCKHEGTRSMVDFGRRVIEVAGKAGIPVVMNDRVDVALAIGAQGVHLGKDDMPITDARRICGPDLIIGATVRNLETGKVSSDAGADYLGVGPIFPTAIKPGLAALPRGVIATIKREISLPIVAIGGINVSNAAMPLKEGADGVAVISALRQCESPKEAASQLRSAIDKAKKR